jgi:tRNA-2-methylthio-N6-dimethylallyladenosine synthase
MEDQIPRAVQNARFDRLLALQEGIALSLNEPLVGKRVRVLCDGPSKTDKGMLSGRTSENKIVFFPDDGTPQGEFIEIEIDRAAPFALYGKHI